MLCCVTSKWKKNFVIGEASRAAGDPQSLPHSLSWHIVDCVEPYCLSLGNPTLRPLSWAPGCSLLHPPHQTHSCPKPPPALVCLSVTSSSSFGVGVGLLSRSPTTALTGFKPSSAILGVSCPRSEPSWEPGALHLLPAGPYCPKDTGREAELVLPGTLGPWEGPGWLPWPPQWSS